LKRFHYFSLLIVPLLLLAACVPEGAIETQAVTSSPPAPQPESPTAEPPTEFPTDIPPTDTPEPSLTPTPSRLPGVPLAFQASADLNNRVVAADPGDPARLAYCAPGEVQVSADGGDTWSAVPAAGVADLAASLGYPIFPLDPSVPPQCFSVTLDAAHPESFFAVFSTAKEEFGAPPLFYMGFYTIDNGTTWQYVPFPQGASLETFGGFYSDGGGTVQALHSPVNAPPASGTGLTLPLLETTDGGANWSPGTLTCPPAGPCLRWGPASMTIPGMGSPLPQYPYFSPDEGQTWDALEPPAELRVAPPNQLVAFSDAAAVRVSGAIAYSASGGSPVTISRDGGQTWEDLPLPPLPGAGSDNPAFPGLQMLPDGSFISQGAETSDWWLLPPDAEGWCTALGATLPAFPVEVRSAGQRLWWVSPDDSSLVQVPIADLFCSSG
jgi:hypothetical protein